VPLDHKVGIPPGMGGKGGQGGLEVMGNIMKVLGGLLGAKAEPDVRFRGFLGVTLGEGDDHPVVKSVLAKGPAGLAGVFVGDRLTRVAGRGVYSPEDVAKRLSLLRPGQSVTLTVKRGGVTKELTVRLGEGL
jgi:S1-C subfamily serine protease